MWTLWGLKCPPPFVKLLVMHLECFVYLHCLQYCSIAHNSNAM